MSRRAELALATLILLIAAFLRLHRLDDLPPGWRDDEIVETSVHAQIVLDGHLPLYFPQAEGHEPLYHYLSAGLIALAGRSLFTVRLLSVFFGLFGLAALYRFARRSFGAPVALVATAALGLSFWSLMYSRFKLRHIGEVGLMLLTYYFFLLPLQHPSRAAVTHRAQRSSALAAGLMLALCLHTYFAARTVPLILLAFVAYLALFHPQCFRTHWRSFVLTFAVAGLLTLPLAWAIARAPDGEARLGIVGKPLLDLLHGDFTYALHTTRDTLGMFAFTGDPEYLYNIPNRPVFEPFGAALFLIGLLVSLWRWKRPHYAFLLIWLLGGLAPAFVSTPAASLSHTLAAQPVMYLFPAIALTAFSFTAENAEAAEKFSSNFSLSAFSALSAVKILSLISLSFFLFLTAARDLHDYFVRWPSLPEVRYLYRAELHEAALQLNARPPASPDLALSSRDLNQFDVAALKLETPRLNLQTRLFDPARAWLLPNQNALALLRQSAQGDGEFGQARRDAPFELRPTLYERGPDAPLAASFANGWTYLGYSLARDAGTLRLHVYWHVDANWQPPAARPIEILSGSPIPLRVFSHVLNPDGSFLAGGDDLGVDPATLYPGDDFIQLLQIRLPPDLPPGNYPLEIGLYNPVSGERVRLVNGSDHLTLTQVPSAP